MSRSADASRAAMFADVSAGAKGVAPSAEAAHKTLLGRGCDPVMAQRSASFLPPLLGGVKVIAASDDDDFVARLRGGKFDVVFFAPGACRWDAARRPIPGGNALTAGWGLKEYRALVRETQGADCAIVETQHESEMVPLLRAALKLS